MTDKYNSKERRQATKIIMDLKYFFYYRCSEMLRASK